MLQELWLPLEVVPVCLHEAAGRYEPSGSCFAGADVGGLTASKASFYITLFDVSVLYFKAIQIYV